ncbi:MAG TPA: ankyrin repeat domain-containing protein [Pyrinomonadaceae bacterium]|nr:ankyrin repeat domain-containing protein [Pyrinomonadaceae bacterium]
MSAKDPLQRLAVTSPCTQDWDSMIGNDSVRFCEHCSLHVHNISAMTRAKALRLAEKSKGRICVRYYHDPNGLVTTKPVSPRLHQLGRRVSRVAAGAFSATLSLTAAVAQSPSGTPGVSPVVQSDGRWALGAVVGGTVKDQHGAVIPGATVALTGSGTNFFTSTNDAGAFRFEGLASGSYTLMVEATGFNRAESSLFLDAPSERQLDLTLTVADVLAEVEISEKQVFVISGGAAIATPSHPFVKAASEDNLEEVARLIVEVDVNLRDEASGTTALEEAVANGNREMVELLLSRGADVKRRTESGRTILMRLDGDATPDLVWDLINAGAEVNAKSETGDTPLIAAAYEENGEILKALLEAGAEVNSKNEDGQTALMVAAEHGRLQNVRALVLAGADINVVDSEGKNALMLAIENQQRTTIRFLRSKGAIETVALATDGDEE